MLVIHGTYRWRRQVLAFRNDYCLSCGRPRLAFLHRTLDVFHLLFIPVLPLGFWKRWLCAGCGSNPHVRVTAAGSLKRAAIASLVLGAIVFWNESPPAPPGWTAETTMFWTLRIGLPVAAALAIAHTLRAKPPEELAAHLRGIAANRDSTCPRCGTTLTVASPWYRCGRCGLERRALPPS